MKRLLVGFLVSLCLILAATPVSAASFDDVKQSDWFYGSVEYVNSHNLFDGTGSNQFSPNAGMTRGMFVTVLGRLYGIDPSAYTDSHFSDVSDGEWYAPYVQWAYSNGITNGISADLFGVNDLVSREQMAKFIVSYLDLVGYYPTEVSSWYSFDDDDDISSYAGYYVHSCQAYGLLTGKGDNLFDPHALSTRAEVATVFERLCRVIQGERITLYYMQTSIPTYDSVTLNFCLFSGYMDGDYFEADYYPWADLFIYGYDSNRLSTYYNYLSSHGFGLIMSETIEGNPTKLYAKGDSYVLISEMWIDGDRYIGILLDKYGAY